MNGFHRPISYPHCGWNFCSVFRKNCLGFISISKTEVKFMLKWIFLGFLIGNTILGIAEWIVKKTW